MPHYKNGQPAKIGELVHHTPSFGGAAEVLGILVSITPGTDTCNGQVVPVARRFGGTTWLPAIAFGVDYITLKDCKLVGGVEISDPTAFPSAPPVPQADGDPRPVSSL